MPAPADRPAQRLPLAAAVASTCAIAVAYASAFVPGGQRWGTWCMVLGVASLVVALGVLGASRRRGGRGIGRLWWPLALAFLAIAGGFSAALLLPADAGAAEPVFLGLPLRAALVVYGVGGFPLLILPLAYALTFDEWTLDERDLDHVRELGRAHRSARQRDGA